MMTLSRSKLSLSAVTLLVWTMATASLGYWGLRLASAGGVEAPAPAVLTPAPAIDSLAVARLLGAVAPAAALQAPAASRFALQGVIAGSPGGGAALIAVDGKPAKPFRVGSVVEEGFILQSTLARQAKLAATRDGPVLLILDMPPLKE